MLGHPGQSFFTVLFGVLIPLVGVAAQTYRLRHATEPVVQQQSRPLRLGLLPMFVVGVIYLVLTQTTDAAWIEDVGLAVFPALFVLVPLALVMGILRYRLWDIDVLASRHAHVGGLGGLHRLPCTWSSSWSSATVSAQVARRGSRSSPTVIAAIAFEPVRERLARFANRLAAYGERGDRRTR